MTWSGGSSRATAAAGASATGPDGGTPIIFIATSQWFLRISDLRDKMLDEVSRVIWYPEWAGSARFADWINLAGGIKIVDTIHVFLFLFFTSFIFVHVYLATLGHTATAHIKAMFTGYEELEEEHSH